ncbi:pseudouridine synthase [Alicyclobacillus cellulosilyticus]|uniref:Pseudouridine synthase n=1 Tax=Alicyclobacillus cellulosilyticus TaxID=1003997 RepID=A0A917KA81_9BACL|nr:16S rRNA pseudouridine(516) synthase [Alicyclobacillus cellulosilyticus]GGJ02978.1 pseudouridine synthase [Alicyclobacillus cellulosilyticus]
MSSGGERLDKVLAHMGIGSRKDIKKLVRAGRVVVDGRVVTDAGMRVVPWEVSILVDGEPVDYRRFIYLMMNKPPGVITATADARHPVVTDLLAEEHRVLRPFPVGRLDKDTEGLLILTNDGQLAHRLLSPHRHVPKVYYARVEGQVGDRDVAVFARGVTLDDGYVTQPGELRILHAGDVSEVELTIYEGKYHQVKRMFAAVGKRVVYLKRMAMGPLWLDERLAPGEYRPLTEEEWRTLMAAVGQDPDDTDEL